MTNTPTQDISRLPKWAQNRLRVLERQVAELENVIAERDAPHAGSNTVVQDFGADAHRPLPNRATIGFGDFTADPGTLPWFQARLLDGPGNGGVGQAGDLEIRAAESLLVVPQATNVVCLRLSRKPR